METFDLQKISENQVISICQFIESKRAEIQSTAGIHLNAVLRDDIFWLLDRYCTVVYYPIDDGSNNGFHVSYPRQNGQEVHFVHINTAQHKEKQIFTAAHELGHIWEVNKFVKGYETANNALEFDEHLMNRFAAELLMPKDLFLPFEKIAVNEATKEGVLTIGGMVQAITAMMNEFFVPYKAVVMRLYELDVIPSKIAKVLLGEGSVPLSIIEEFSKTVAKKQGFDRLYQVDRRKFIDGLNELLDKAIEQGAMPEQWLKNFAERFEIQVKASDEVMDTPIEIKRNEDIDDAGQCGH